MTDPFGEGATYAQRRRFDLLGAPVEFLANDARLIRIVDSAFGGLPAHRWRRGTQPLRVVLRLDADTDALPARLPEPRLTSGGGMYAAHFDARNFAVVTPAARAALIHVSRAMLEHPYHLRYELLEFALATLAARAEGLAPLHGACVAWRGRAALLMGDSGAGKTTACLHAVLAGLELVSEDSVFVAPRATRVTGIASFLHVRAPEGHARGPFGEIRRRSGQRKLVIDVRRAGLRMAPRPPALAAVVLLSTRHSQGALLRPLGRTRLEARLRQLQPYAAVQESWPRFMTMLRRVPVYELRRGVSPAAGAEALRTLLARRTSRKATRGRG
jgi:hypothetical protein